MPFMQQLGMQAAQDAAGSIMGMVAGGINDKRQLKQQGKLQKLQMQGNKEMMDYQMMKELEMWKNTGYEAQKKLMKEAGLNPALLYGMGGGGGQSVGSATASVTGGQAPNDGREIMDMVSQTTQRQMMEAQRKNIEADTKLKEADAAKTSGVDTTLAETNIKNIAADTKNKEAQNTLLKIDALLNEIELDISKQSKDNRIGIAEYTFQKIAAEAEKLTVEAGITQETKDAVIKEIIQRSIGAEIENELKTNNIALTKEQIKLITQEISQNPDYLEISKRDISNKELATKAGINIQTADVIVRGITNLIGIGALGKLLKGGRTVIQGFGKKY